MARTSRGERIASLFDAVVDLDADSRQAVLSTADPDVSAEVVSLISALGRSGDWLETPRSGALGVEEPMRRIGAYRLVRRVGQGGMGAVYEAERADATYVKRVAIKLIRDDVGGREIARRFARERAILAGLEHPGISRMLDGGTLEDGREYLVMEFVDGVPITTWCAVSGAGLHDRLELFLQVCDAVQFSHQHLVVHGDIKPGNLLVTPEGVVKLVDFGVAKVIDEADPRTRDPLTALGALTPAYASPEQWRGDSLSMLSDVYSLGVVLYELLVGTRPFAIESRTTQDILVAIEGGAKAPSAAVLPDTRRSKSLEGELDTIVLTALESSPQRRYASVERFADDIRRHLDGRMVLAQPATRRYRATKFLRRYRKTVIAGSALAVALLGGGIVATVQARRANQQRAVAEKISGFLRQLLSAPDASWVNAGKADVRVADVLDAAVAQADTGLRQYPAAEAMIRRTIGAAYRSLSRFDDADRQLKLALAIDVKRGAPDFPDLAETYHELGWSSYARGDWKTAMNYYREANQRCGVREADTSVVCFKAVADYALALTTRNRLAEAESLYLDVVRRGKLRFGENAAPLSVIYGNMGFIADVRGDLQHAEPWHRLALASWHAGPEPAERAVFFHSLALNQVLQGKLKVADSVVAEGLKSVAATKQERSFPAMMLYLDGAVSRRRAGDSAGAADFRARAKGAIPPNISPTHPLVGSIGVEDGMARLVAGDPAAAETLLKAAEKVRIAAYVPTDVRLVRLSAMVGVTEVAQAKYESGIARMKAALPVLQATYPPDHAYTLEVRDALAEAEAARAAGEDAPAAAKRFARFMVGRP